MFLLMAGWAIGLLSCPLGRVGQIPTAHAPRVEIRREVHYVAIRTAISMDKMPEALPRLWGEVSGWMRHTGIRPSGPPILRYLVIDMPRRIEMDVGVPVAKHIHGNGRIRGGKLPGGQYAVVQHKGPYDGLVKANATLQDWAKSRGLVMRARTTKLGTVWDGRAEFYLRDPGNEKDPKSYVTEITYAVAGRKVGR